MTSSQTYNFKPVKTGETFQGVGFQLIINGNPKDLTGAVIDMVIIGNDMVVFSTTTGELEITYPSLGKFILPKRNISLPPQDHAYYITFTFPNGDKKTYIKGTWPILP